MAEKKAKTVNEVIGGTIFKAVKPIYQEGERARRGQSQSRSRFYTPAPKWSQKEIVFGVLPQAIRNAGAQKSKRDLYYAVRPLAYAHYGWPAGKTLDYNYFAQSLLTEYQEIRGPITGLYSDPRGHLHEPHARYALPLRDPYGELVEEEKRVTLPLGTREVADYDFPPYLYDKILYVEKEGEWPKFEAAKLAERYDMAIAAGKGYATEAVRTLLQKAERDKEYQIFVFHDADIDGYEIARTLREETRRMAGYSVEVIDLGLTVADAVGLGLDPEPYRRDKELPWDLERRLTDLEREYFTVPNGKRFELNAILPVEDRIAHIERKLEENGVRPKLIPPDEDLDRLVGGIYRDKHAAWVDEVLKGLLGLPALKAALADEFAEKFALPDARRHIEEGFEKDKTLSWREALENKLAAVQEEHAAALKNAVRERIVEAVRGGGAQ